MISKTAHKAKKQLTKHSQSRHHKMFEMIKNNDIKFELFNIGQLRYINKLNIKEDGNYIVKNITDKKKEIIVQTFKDYEGDIIIPDEILTISK
jgi:hypothetical protein